MNSSVDESSIYVANNFIVPFKEETKFSITSDFGYRLDPFNNDEINFHNGIDLGAKCNEPVIASSDGIVYEIGTNDSGLGNYIYLEHDNLLYTIYGHLSEIIVAKDDVINKGDIIGYVGNTGLSTGCHLHFMITKGILSFEKEHLIDPSFVIYGLEGRKNNKE